jgi:precorrin-6B methylase 1
MIQVIGCGPGHRDGMTIEALRQVRRAQVLIGSARLLALFPNHRALKIETSHPAPTLQALREHGDKDCAVLVTGDPGIASLARAVRAEFPSQVRTIAGVSSAIAACAVAGFDWEGAQFLSLHAGRNTLTASPTAAEKFVVLGGHPEAGRSLLAWLGASSSLWECWSVRDAGLPEQSLCRLELPALATLDATGRVIFLLHRKTLSRSENS